MPGTRMIQWLCMPAVWALGSTAHAAIPAGGHLQDFDSEHACGTTCGTSCTLADTVWSNVAGDGADWTVDAGGTPSSGTGPSGDHTTGMGNYAYIEASGGHCSSGVEAHLVTTDLVLERDHHYRFAFWYHLYGEMQGNLYVDIDPDGGADTFTNILTLTDNVDRWQFQRVDLSSYAAGTDATVNLRIRGVTGAGFASDMAIDDLSIEEYFDKDVGIASIDAPAASGCDLGMETVSVTVANDGAAAQSGFPIVMIIDGGAPVIETFDATIDPGAKASYTFVAPAPLGAHGGHTLDVHTALPEDTNGANDGVSRSIHNSTRVSVFPSLEDFESANVSPWVTGGMRSSWALGTPRNVVITGAASGLVAWATNLAGSYNNGENSWVQSQCGYDFSDLSNPTIRMSIWWESESSWDGANLQSSVNGGSSWNNVGALGDPYNWYTDNSISGNPGNSPEGWTGRDGMGSNGWVQAAHALDGLAGASDVLLRVTFGSDADINDEGFAFDDIEIFEDRDSVLVEGRGPRPSISALTRGASNLHTLTFWTEARGRDQTIHSITVAHGGTLRDTDVSAVRLWLDNGDGVLDLTRDTQIGVDQTFVGGATTFSVDLMTAKWVRQTLFVTVDIAPRAAAGSVFESRIPDAAALEVVGGAPVSLRNQVQGPEFGVFGLVDTLPFADGIGEAAVFNRLASFRAGNHPAAAAAGPNVSEMATAADSSVDVGDATTVPGPASGRYMGVIDFPQGAAAGAIEYAFDLGAYTVADDLLWLRFSWNNTSQEDSDLNNVFVSTDGGVAWDASLFRWDFTSRVPQGWHVETLDLTAALAAAGIDYSSDMRIRFQAGGDEPGLDDGLQIDDVWLGEPQRAALARDALGIARGATDDTGRLPIGPVTLTYAIENSGHLPLNIDPASFAITGESNVANVVITPPALTAVEPGDAQTFEVRFDILELGAFSFDIEFITDDPRLPVASGGSGKSYTFTVTGTGDPQSGGCCSGSSDRLPTGSLLLALLAVALMIRPRRRLRSRCSPPNRG